MKRLAGYIPNPRFTDLFPETSGNTVNGLGETEVRRASPFFWHPADKHDFGALQHEVIAYHRNSPEICEVFNPKAPRGPKPVERAKTRVEKPAADWAQEIKNFVLGDEGDLVGITAMDPMYTYEGYEIAHPWIIMIGVTMDYGELSKAPPSFEDPSAGVEVGRQYNRAARVCRRLANFILEQGWDAKAWPGPYASALNMIPAAIAAGLGELGKHGSMINRIHGSAFRLSAVTTDMPLIADKPDDIGVDDFCANCRICSEACPPQAIFDEKQMVRGVKKWYVDFDKCIPYFGETLACGICIARCPWSRPGTGPRLADKLARRRARKADEQNR
ncbi:MAG: 4Fe-4S dicluster domain-containing protein [Alphaproteobacteria bacterium]|nr:MAG: 4Fe-4S dicluster domain-containing protein [Alphaproteobacteria bacterium]